MGGGRGSNGDASTTVGDKLSVPPPNKMAPIIEARVPLNVEPRAGDALLAASFRANTDVDFAVFALLRRRASHGGDQAVLRVVLVALVLLPDSPCRAPPRSVRSTFFPRGVKPTPSPTCALDKTSMVQNSAAHIYVCGCRSPPWHGRSALFYLCPALLLSCAFPVGAPAEEHQTASTSEGIPWCLFIREPPFSGGICSLALPHASAAPPCSCICPLSRTRTGCSLALLPSD